MALAPEFVAFMQHCGRLVATDVDVTEVCVSRTCKGNGGGLVGGISIEVGRPWLRSFSSGHRIQRPFVQQRRRLCGDGSGGIFVCRLFCFGCLLLMVLLFFKWTFKFLSRKLIFVGCVFPL